ncbi:hypothetical protein O6H91_14G065800 [Diphasiastrum complanatum]|uniref:Uncharacterized protein n=1 Tax=Diphasiastrum complanatum TaxID=34168 RepID=A0ACC2BQ81_DIPCM|nr:hypothetical protein O6H91_14G065800 [Diphasiastrum complanatum]
MIEATEDDINITTKEHLIEKTQLDLYGDDNFSKQELRRIKMKEREKEYIEFLHTKPDEDVEEYLEKTEVHEPKNEELRLLQRFQPQEETLELRHTGKLVESQDITVGDICPPGCDEAIYQMVRELREKRLEQDDLISESTRQLEIIQREKDSRLKKRKAIDAALQSIERDMEEFQKEKQNALNQIDIVLSLYMNQVEYVVDGKMSEELSGALVFGNSSLKNLKATIQQHVGEKVALRQLQKELQNQHSALVRERRANENKAAELEQRVIDVQMLKFGQVIDLDVIDSMRVQKTTLDLKEHMKTQEAHHAFELDSWDQKINHAIDELAIAMKKNAALLNVIADVKEKQSAIEQTMRAKATTTFRDPLIEKKRDVVELARLKQVVNVQAKQIENLATELRVLHRDKQSIFP